MSSELIVFHRQRTYVGVEVLSQHKKSTFAPQSVLEHVLLDIVGESRGSAVDYYVTRGTGNCL